MFNEKRISRREALERLSAGSLLALGLWPGALRAADDNRTGSFRFAVLNDLHYMSPDCGRWLEGVLRDIKSHGDVEFCLVAGDLTEYGRREDFAAVRDIFKASGLPAYVVIGNHDYLAEKPPGPPPKKFQPRYSPKDERRFARRIPGKYDRRAYDQFFPRRINYVFKHRGWQFVGLDTSEGTLYEKTKIPAATFQWLDAAVPKLDKKLPTVIFTHFPLGPNVKYRPANADDLLERFKACNLQAAFCGHFHGFTERQLGATTFTTDRCCALKRGNHDGTKEKGYFLCAAAGGKITRSFVQVKDRGAA